MQKPLFYVDKVKAWEIIILIFYVLLSVEAYFFLRLANNETQNHCLYFYAFFTQLFLYGGFYKAMRNLKVYILFLIIGILHLFLYYLLKENAALIGLDNTKVIPLRNTVILLFLFQFLRYISLRTQKQELVSIRRYGKRDIFNERETTRIDSILYIIYITSTFLLLFVG